MARRGLIVGAVLVAAVAAACGGGGGSKTATPGGGTTAAAGAATSVKTSAGAGAASATVPSVPSTAVLPTSAAAGTPSSGGVSTPATGGGGGAVDAARAKAQIGAAMLTPADLPAGWKVASDTTQDNAAAAAADPANAASIERCGRLLGRTLVTQPADIVNAYIGGETVSFFSTAVAYATSAGAADCAAETAVRYQKPGELARAFGTVFTDANAVAIATVDFPQVGDGSFAVTLSGQTNASGVVVDLVLLVVGFRKGNVTGAIGSAASAAPKTAELAPLIDKVLARIAAAQ